MLLKTLLVLAVLTPTLLADSFSQRDPGLVSCGDVNHDGVPDLLVASRDTREPALVWLVSGKDGHVLHVFRSRDDALGFGASISAPGDLDGDGLPEVVISTNGFQTVVKSGNDEPGNRSPTSFGLEDRGQPRCEVFSSRDHALLLELPSAGLIAVLRDRTGDDRADFAFLAFKPRAAPSRDEHVAEDVTTLTIRSGKDASVILDIAPPKERMFSSALCSPGDVNGDALADVAVVVSTREHNPWARTANVAVLSGKDGGELWRERDRSAAFIQLSCTADLDHDGFFDVLAGIESREVRALSGSSGKLLYRVPGPRSTFALDSFASSLDGIGDVDGDEIADWVVGASEGHPFFDEGYVWLCSGKDGHRIRELAKSPMLGMNVCSLGDVDGDRVPEVAVLLEDPNERQSGWDPILSIVSTKDGKAVWERDTVALRKAVEQAPTHETK